MRGSLNESPSEKEGKSACPPEVGGSDCEPSMKVPPKRKGNHVWAVGACLGLALNESPSEKEGKLVSVMTENHTLSSPQ